MNLPRPRSDSECLRPQRRPRPPHGAKFFDFARNDAQEIGHGRNKYPLSAAEAHAHRNAGVPKVWPPPQFALNDSQSVPKAARLERHERRQRTRETPFLTKLRQRLARRLETFCEGTGMR